MDLSSVTDSIGIGQIAIQAGKHINRNQFTLTHLSAWPFEGRHASRLADRFADRLADLLADFPSDRPILIAKS